MSRDPNKRENYKNQFLPPGHSPLRTKLLLFTVQYYSLCHKTEFANMDSNKEHLSLLAVCIISIVLSWIAVGIRMVIRNARGTLFRADDVLVIVSMVRLNEFQQGKGRF